MTAEEFNQLGYKGDEKVEVTYRDSTKTQETLVWGKARKDRDGNYFVGVEHKFTGGEKAIYLDTIRSVTKV